MVEQLTVISGSMFSGKTGELIEQLTRAEIGGKKTQVFKPIIDDRYGAVDEIRSHANASHSAIPISSSVEALEKIEDGVDIVGFDEVQFFDDDIVAVVTALLEADIEVYIAGLPQDFRGEPFGKMPELLAMADDIQRLTAVCDYNDNGEVCADDATKTQRFLDGEPAGYHDPVVIIGGKKEGYAARCGKHYVIVDKPQGIIFQSK